MKKLLPLALIVTTLFACNTHSDKGSAGAPFANPNDVLTVNNMYDISVVRAAMGKGDAAASQKAFARAMNGYIKGGAPSCPGGGAYTYNAVDTAPVCNITSHTL